MSDPVYLDNMATTPLDPAARSAMLPYLDEHFGNPHSAGHAYGWRAEAGVDKARAQIAAAIGASPDEIIFTSGATEANNLALKGLMAGIDAARPRLITSAIEHKCVLESAAALGRAGLDVMTIAVDGRGQLDRAEFDDALDHRTGLVSVMLVNNEIGTIAPIVDIARQARDAGAFFHCDAAQGLGKIPIDVEAMGIDLMSLSAHKIYGPKGIGALFVRAELQPRIVPLFHGGGQERGLRSGTLAPALIAGFGAAVAVAAARMAEDAAHIAALARRLREGLRQLAPDCGFNGDADRGWPGTVNVSFRALRPDRFFSALAGLAVSPGAACASGSAEPSYVLDAIGVERALAQSSLRFGIGRFTTTADIDRALAIVGRALDAARPHRRHA